MGKFLLKHKLIIMILTLSTFIVWPIFMPGYFSHHDDLQVMRIFEMRKCIEDLQIPCRWVPDMGYENGFPLFNFYGPFPYYIGALASYFMGYLNAAKLLFLIPLIMGSVAMFFLAREIAGEIAGFTSGILYMFAPYRALDIYVRGDIAESFALFLVILFFYFGLKFVRNKSKKYFILAIFSVAAFFTTHNIMVMLFSPVFMLFFLYAFFLEDKKNTKLLFLGVLLGLGLATFFLVPAFFEKELVQIDSLTRFDLDFRANFVTVYQLFLDRFWGYGASVLGSQDTISFQIGWPQWWIVCISLVLFILNKAGIFKGEEKISFRNTFFFVGLIGIFVFSIFMTHNKSAFVWEAIGILRFVQFPWRFLGLTIFSIGLINAFAFKFINLKLQMFLALVVIILTIFLNAYFFQPQVFYTNMTDQKKLSGQEWDKQTRAALLDYLPKTALEPGYPAKPLPEVIKGKAYINNFLKKSNKWSFNASVKTDALIELPVFYFPEWVVYSENKKIDYNHNNTHGRIQFNLLKGEYKLVGKFTDTPVRLISNIISLISILLFLFLIFSKKNILKFK